MDELDMLNAIMRQDPDGGDVQPTEADYVAHELWAVKRFGREVWATYKKGGWDDHNYA